MAYLNEEQFQDKKDIKKFIGLRILIILAFLINLIEIIEIVGLWNQEQTISRDVFVNIIDIVLLCFGYIGLWYKKKWGLLLTLCYMLVKPWLIIHFDLAGIAIGVLMTFLSCIIWYVFLGRFWSDFS